MAPPRPAPVPKTRSVRQAEPAHQQRALAGLFLAMLSLFGLLGGLHNFQRGIYIVAFTLLAGVLAVWLAITSLARARRGGTMSPRGSVTAIVVGTLGVLLSGFLADRARGLRPAGGQVLAVLQRREHPRGQAGVPEPVHPRDPGRHLRPVTKHAVTCPVTAAR